MTGIRSILATHFVGYLGALMSVLGNSKCFENAALGRMRRLPQNLLATSSSDFDFQVGWLEPDQASYYVSCYVKIAVFIKQIYLVSWQQKQKH